MGVVTGLYCPVRCIAGFVSVWCQLGSAYLSGASWALTLETLSIWLSTGACCVPVTPPPLSELLLPVRSHRFEIPTTSWDVAKKAKFVGYPTFCLTT